MPQPIARGPSLSGDQTDQDLARLASDLAAEGEAAPGSRTLVIVPDRTRAYPLTDVLPTLLAGLIARGVSPESITVAIAAGTHVAGDADVANLGELPREVRILRHDADGPCVSVGRTGRGTAVEVHPALLEADTVFALGGLAFHYFAGFGGGGKMLFPGLGARASIAANHRLALAPERGLAAGVEPGRTGDNPVALDLREAHLMLPRAHHLTMWDDEGGWRGVRWTEFAAFDAICARFAGFSPSLERHGYDFVGAGCGMAPRGIDVVQAHKSLFHAALFTRDGGELFLWAPCPEGIGSPALARWLELPDRATLEARARSAYDLNAQTAISLAAIAERVRVTWVARNPPRVLERWGMTLETDLERARLLGIARLEEGLRVLTLEQPTGAIPSGRAAL